MEAFSFIITLKNEKRKLYSQIGVFILLGLMLAYSYRRFAEHQFQFTYKILLLPIAFLLFILLYRFYKNTKHQFGLEVFFVVTVGAALSAKDFWLAGISFVFFILFLAAVRDKMVCISEKKILYPAFPKRNIQWNELNNMLLKDGLLTLDFKNNKIIQQLADEEKNIPDEEEFNEFCRQQLNKCN